MASTDVTRTYGRLHYRDAARQIRRIRRTWDETNPEVAETATAAYVALFTADATRAGDAEHFDAELFTSRTQLLPADQLAEIKAAKTAKFLAAHPELADLEAEFGESDE